MNNSNNAEFAFMKLKTEVKGVKRAFVFSKYNENSADSLERDLKYLMSFLSAWVPLKRIFIQTFKGEIIVCATETFFVGAVITNEANPTLVEMILTRIVSNLDDYATTFKATPVEFLKEKIQKRIEDLPHRTIPETVTLTLKNVGIEGEITVNTAAQDKNRVKKGIQDIIDEEIPFFCKKHITIDVKTKI